MNYKIKYFLYYSCVIFLLFFALIILLVFSEMISTRSFKIVIDLPNIHIAFLAILIFSFLMSFTAIPFYAKPSKKTFTFKNEMEKDYILKEIDEVIKTSKESNVKKRTRIDISDKKTIYSSGIKILDYVIQPIVVNVDEDLIKVDANSFFVEKISKELNRI